MSASLETANQSILIVDNDRESVEKIKNLLKKISLRLTVVNADDAVNAIDRAKKKSFDILVVSEQGEKLSGTYVINKILDIKEIPPPRLIAFLAASDDKPDVGNLDNLTILKKPLNDDDIQKYFRDSLLKLQQAVEVSEARPRSNFKVDVNFINPFIEGTLNVLKTTCQVNCKKDKVFIRNDDTISGDISALIGMISPKFKGSLGIAMEKSTFLYIVNSMLGEKYTSITAENRDAAGEVCNQVFGFAKTKLNEMGHALQPAIPSVIVGDRHKIKHLVTGPIIAVRFETEGGYFTIEAAVT